MNWYFSSGDLDFFWKEQIQHLSWLPDIYRTDVGFGWSGLMSLWIDYPFRLVLKLLSTIGLSWFFIEKLLWLLVFIVAVYSSYHFAKYILQSRLSSWLASFIYSTNTYFLLLFSGGQFGVALAYAFSPFVLLKFIQSDNQKILTKVLCLALLIMFDLRLACLLLGVIILYQICTKTFHFLKMGISLLVAALIHSFWILPTIMSRTGLSVMGEDFTNPGMLRFLSFADFPHTLSLLHPNWPENLFGKVYFLQPEFLFIPLIAYSALLFKTKKKTIVFFALIAILGTFFAKGAQQPFGNIFIWCFQHIPGFIMFRDPTKFYLFIALGYSILIPFTLGQLAHVIGIKYQVSSIKYKKGIHNTLYIILYSFFVVFWLVALRAVITGEVRGNFRPVQLPNEYIQLKDTLITDVVPSRTLWIPQKENFAYFSDVHPIVTATDAAAIDSSIKYIIVPVDVNRRIFLNDYKYDFVMRNNIIEELSNKGLLRDEQFQNLAVFENPQFHGMKITVPDIVKMQQFYANIGVFISVVVLIVLGIYIVWF